MLDAVVQYVLSWCTPMNIAIYVLVNTLPVWYVIYSSKKLEGTPELNEKYWAFHRTDYKYWSYVKFPLLNMIFLWPFRYALAWSMVLTQCTFIVIIMCGQRKDAKMPKWRQTLLRWSIIGPSRIHMLAGGVIWCNFTKKPEVCYKKWLGPYWKPTFEGAGIQVSNHQSWIDIMALLYY